MTEQSARRSAKSRGLRLHLARAIIKACLSSCHLHIEQLLGRKTARSIFRINVTLAHCSVLHIRHCARLITQSAEWQAAAAKWSSLSQHKAAATREHKEATRPGFLFWCAAGPISPRHQTHREI